MRMTEFWVMPSERARRHRRGDDDVVAHREDVLAGALGDQPVGRQHDRLVVATLQRLHLGERRVDVVARRLRRRRHRVVIVPCPRGDLHAHAVIQRVLTEEWCPRPTCDRHVDTARQRVESHLPVAVVRDGADVATRQLGRGDGGLRCGDDLSDAVGHLHAHDVARFGRDARCARSTGTRPGLEMWGRRESPRTRRCRSATCA